MCLEEVILGIWNMLIRYVQSEYIDMAFVNREDEAMIIPKAFSPGYPIEKLLLENRKMAGICK